MNHNLFFLTFGLCKRPAHGVIWSATMTFSKAGVPSINASQSARSIPSGMVLLYKDCTLQRPREKDTSENEAKRETQIVSRTGQSTGPFGTLGGFDPSLHLRPGDPDSQRDPFPLKDSYDITKIAAVREPKSTLNLSRHNFQGW